jgi:hypothetical protein
MAWLGSHTDRGSRFFSATGPMFYVLLDLWNPAAVPMVEPNEYTRPHQVAQTARRLHELRPRYVLWPFGPEPTDEPGDRLNELREELRAGYRPVASLPDGEIWERMPVHADSERKIRKLAD